jgi:hypothetical protein
MRFISSLKALAPLASVALVAAPALAADPNLGFELGNTSGWTQHGGTVGATPAPWAPAQGTSPTFSPVDGDFFGYVTAGENRDVASLSRTFQLAAGGTITGYAGFANLDGDGYFPDTSHFYDDIGFLAVNGIHLLDLDGLSVGGFANSGWIPFTFTAPTQGFYTLEIGVANGEDPNVPSSMLIDNVQVTGQVPEVATWAMMVAGFGLAGLSLRSRRAAVSFG